MGKIGLVSVGKKDINALIDGYIEIKKESTGDAVEIYLEAEPQTWYYLKYTNNVMLAKAQHGSFDEIIGLKAKGDYNTATEYGFYLGDDQEVQLFLNHFRKDYLKETGKRKVNLNQPQSTGNFDFDQDTSKKKKKEEEERPSRGRHAGHAAGRRPPEETGKQKEEEQGRSGGRRAARCRRSPDRRTERRRRRKRRKTRPTTPSASN